MNVAFYLAIRCLLWLGAVTVSLLPVLIQDDVDIAMNPWTTVRSVNHAKLFKELYFVIVPVAVLSISTIVDYWCRSHKKITGTLFALTILALFFQIASLGAGLIGFMKISIGSPLADGPLWNYFIVVIYALVVSLATEVGISFTHR